MAKPAELQHPRARRSRRAEAGRGEGHDASTRERILDAALEAFSDEGYEGASTRAIATRAGVNQGMIPYYFGSKEALWREAASRAFAELRHELGDGPAAIPGSDPQQVARTIRSFVRFVARRPAFARLMNGEGKREGPRMRWLVERHVRPMFEAVGALDRLGASGRPGADAIAFYVLIGAATQIFHQAPECRHLTGIDPTEPRVVEALADALVDLFVPEAKERSES